MQLPPNLKEMWKREPEWLDELPRVVRELAAAWDLALEEPIDTPRSLVVPAGDVVLKLNAPSHVEADHEADALLQWDGRGAVRVVARADEHRAFLIERCRPGTRLWDSGADEPSVVAELLPRLWSEGTEPHPFRLAADEARRWDEEVAVRYEHGGRPFEQALVDLASDVFRTADPGAKALVNQDLHGGNILSATREPWLVIDPKPLVGERELDAVGLLRNAALNGGAPAVRRWLEMLAKLGLDRERAQAWGVAHALAWGWAGGAWSTRSVDAARVIASA
ncbi:MAG TPA: aminoglycoside phosphotransferase family protein [Actinomycetota bacterium]|jgi:streptomycin 6-kinase|nr:aminoglycoside phosphotransferase family protein [Actinomycetota bacterium]